METRGANEDAFLPNINTADRGVGATPTMSHQPAVIDDRTVDAPRIGSQYFICECCPKKPKKLLDEEGLRYVISYYKLTFLLRSARMHVEEKQYQCSYCTNRFKNKNEMERHQNSLHLRRLSWSCAAISGYEAFIGLTYFSNI